MGSKHVFQKQLVILLAVTDMVTVTSKKRLK